MTTVINEGRRTAEFLASEADGYLSREEVTLLEGQNLKAGSVLGMITSGGAVTVEKTDVGGGKGAITLANPAYGAGVQNGRYKVIVVEPATDAGKFVIEGPDGVVVLSGTIGVAVDDVLKFTWADGATDVAAGDIAYIDVSIADPTNVNKYKQWNPSNSDGSEVAVAVLYANVDASEADHAATIIARQAEVNGLVLEYFTGADSDDKALAKSQLKAQTIIVR